MNYKTLKIGILLLLASFAMQGQEANNNKQDLAAIQETIDMYFEGWLTGDTTLIGTAMHPTCHLKFTPGGEFGVRDRNGYLSGFKLRPRLADAEGRIMSIDITRNAAAAKVELEIPGRIFTDYFNMMRIDGRWYIMDKISTNIGTGN